MIGDRSIDLVVALARESLEADLYQLAAGLGVGLGSPAERASYHEAMDHRCPSPPRVWAGVELTVEERAAWIRLGLKVGP